MSTTSEPLSAPVIAPMPAVAPQDPAVPSEIYAEIARLGVAGQFPDVIALTRELFGDFTVDVSVDPEIPNCSYVTFNVRTEEAYNIAFQKESEWIRRLPRRPTQAPASFCLDIGYIE
jgi:hypothetical protein